jgi:hypothetical protein
MNKQAAKLAKTTALLNSTSIQLRISGLMIRVIALYWEALGLMRRVF